MSLRGVVMLYERIMATRRSTGRLRDHNTYVASIFIGRDIRLPPPPPFPHHPARAKGACSSSRWCQTGCQTAAARSPSVFLRPSRSPPLVYSFTYAYGREHMFTNNVISTRVRSRKANKPRRSRLRDSTARPFDSASLFYSTYLIPFILITLEF